MRASRGVAIPLALVLMLVALPAGLAFVSLSTRYLKSALHDKHAKGAEGLAASAVMDLMRQFSQDHYDGHYDASAIARAPAFYEVGFSSVTVEADEVNHTLFIEAWGGYGADAADPHARRRLRAVIRFMSDLTRFGTMLNGPIGISASNVTYNGGFWSNGNVTVSGRNVTFQGGPVISNGSVNGNGSTVVNGNLYRSGTHNVTVNGNAFPFLPPVSWPALNLGYYSRNYHYKTTRSRTIQFNRNGTFTVVGTPTTIAIPPGGAIIYGENCNLTIRGTVRGRVTVVAGGAAGSRSQGRITVSDNLVYANGTNRASAEDSIAVLAKNRITFRRYRRDLTVNGIFFVEQGTSNMYLQGSSGRRFRLYGMRSQIIRISPGYAFSRERTLDHDPNLQDFPPPGLPEKPLLVTWDLR